MPVDELRSGTIAELINFLQNCAHDRDLNPGSMSGLKSCVRVVTTGLGIDDTNIVASLDVDELMDRYQQMKGTSFRSADTYQARIRTAIQLYTAWLNDDPKWKTLARSRPYVRSDALRTPSEMTTTHIIDFPITADLIVRIELPRTLAKHQANRLHHLIDSLVIDNT
jgi:hypothetical protein